MIRLARLEDGRLALTSNRPFPADILRVEYYREQRLFLLVYETEEAGSDLMPCEIRPETADLVQSSPDIQVIMLPENEQGPYGYTVPLIQVGV